MRLKTNIFQSRGFILFIFVAISLSYAVYQWIYIPYWALSADEFVFARHIYDYTFQIPYRDFSPYKSVMGYYLLSLPFYFSHDFLNSLFYIKYEIAALNLILFSLIIWWSSKYFHRYAILFTVLLVLSNQLFLIYASDLRVDMLTAWFCLLANLAILDHRMKLAGFFIGIAFLISQKALWYLFSILAGLLLCRLFIINSYTITQCGLFLFSSAFTVLIYVAFWSVYSDYLTVWNSLFYEAYIQSKIDIYTAVYGRCWQIALNHGPILFLLAPISLLTLYVKKLSCQQFFIVGSGFICILMYTSYKQPFPYNFVFLIPAFYLLYCNFFDWCIQKYLHSVKINWLIWIVYIALSVGVIYISDIDVAYYLISAMLVIIGFFLRKPKKWLCSSILILLLITGIILPLKTTWYLSNLIDGSYQRKMLTLTHLILDKNDNYLAGVPYFFDHDTQTIGMKNLIAPALVYLSQPSDKVKVLLLPSLYIEVTNPNDVIANLQATPPKVILNNYRLFYLPSSIRNYFNNNYQHFYGSIYIYAPSIAAGHQNCSIKYSGRYRIKSENAIIFDGKRYLPGDVMMVRNGYHLSFSPRNYRLILSPEIDKNLLNAKDMNDQWVSMLKTISL